MTILDAYAVVAHLLGETAAPEVAVLLGMDDRALTATGLAEVLDRMIRVAGVDEEEIALDLEDMGLLDAMPVTSSTALAAGRLRARRYHRTACAVSLADCVAAEAARSLDRPLATADPHLLDLCEAEGLAVVVLPQSDGSRWSPAGGPGD